MLWFGPSTGYGVVKRISFKNILCYGSALDAHNCSNHNRIFKNILCYGSAITSLVGGAPDAYLKTSYVMVRQSLGMPWIMYSMI